MLGRQDLEIFRMVYHSLFIMKTRIRKERSMRVACVKENTRFTFYIKRKQCYNLNKTCSILRENIYTSTSTKYIN